MTRDDLVQRLVDLQREIGSTANGAHCYGVWARRIGEIIAALAAPPAAPSADLVALVREMECPNCGETAARADLNGHFHDGDALASPRRRPRRVLAVIRCARVESARGRRIGVADRAGHRLDAALLDGPRHRRP